MQYINTGIAAKSNIKIVMDFINKEATGATIIGYNGSESNTFRFFNASNICYLDYGSGSGYNRISGGEILPNKEYILEIGNRYVKDLETEEYIV